MYVYPLSKHSQNNPTETIVNNQLYFSPCVHVLAMIAILVRQMLPNFLVT
jgi:hypothetical protein